MYSVLVWYVALKHSIVYVIPQKFNDMLMVVFNKVTQPITKIELYILHLLNII